MTFEELITLLKVLAVDNCDKTPPEFVKIAEKSISEIMESRAKALEQADEVHSN